MAASRGSSRELAGEGGLGGGGGAGEGAGAHWGPGAAYLGHGGTCPGEAAPAC